MAADALVVPAGNKIRFVNGDFDMDGDALQLALFDSSYVTTVTTYTTTNELTTANGYTQGGTTLAYGGTTRLAEAGGVVTFDADDVVWSVVTANLVHQYGQISQEAGSLYVMGYIHADNAPADVTVTPGNDLTYQWNASGVFTLT